jgi:hypothetical protein
MSRWPESRARTVSRPKLIVPTNLQMAIVGDGIVNVVGIMCGSSWNGWREARLEMLQSIGDADCSRKKLWCCCHSCHTILLRSRGVGLPGSRRGSLLLRQRRWPSLSPMLDHEQLAGRPFLAVNTSTFKSEKAQKSNLEIHTISVSSLQMLKRSATL